MDYAHEYNTYWNSRERSTPSQEALTLLAQEIMRTCGPRNILDVGCGEGFLVDVFLAQGVNAYGVDCAYTVIERCLLSKPGRFYTASTLELPFGENAFDTVVSIDLLQHLQPEDVPAALCELHRVCQRHFFLKVDICPDHAGHLHRTVQPRLWWEKECLEAGFRLHPREMHVVSYESRNYEISPCTLILEKIPRKVLAQYSLSTLAAERDLHMDMLREAGRRAEAHRMRYHAAAEDIHRGDVVLDVACGLGYGAHMLYANSLASKIIGVDASPYAIEYARQNYASEGVVSFHLGDVHNLSFLPDNSIDHIVSFETLEHIERPSQFLKEMHRVLRPAGRVIVSVPNNWADETGNDPNPWHLHVYTWPKLLEQMSEFFLLEKAFLQNAGGVMRCTAQRRWEQASVHIPNCDTAEWLMVQGMKNPTAGKGIDYVERYHRTPKEWQFADNAKESTYVNPWLFSALNLLLLQDKENLTRLLQEILATSPYSSADYAHALCALAYREVEKTSSALPVALLEHIQQWIQQAAERPIDLRWKISLFYVCGLLYLRGGDFIQAEIAFTNCAAIDPLLITPTLGTKTVPARYKLALLALGKNEKERARKLLQETLHEAWRLLGAGGVETIGDMNDPLWCNILEMRQILDTAQAAMVLLADVDSVDKRMASIVSANPLYPYTPPMDKYALLENSLQAAANRLAGKEVFFWGCGDLYARRKSLFTNCLPKAILLDYNPENILEKDGIRVMSPAEALSKSEKIPIILFAWNPWPILLTLEKQFPQYTAEDIVFCNVLRIT